MIEESESNVSSYEEVKNELQNFRNNIAFPNLSPPGDVDLIFTEIIDPSLRKGIGPYEASEYATVLSCYSFYLTKQINRCKSFIYWCDERIKQIVGSEIDNIPENFLYGFQEKDTYIRANNPVARELVNQRIIAQCKLMQFEGFDDRVNQVSQMLRNHAYQNKNRRGH